MPKRITPRNSTQPLPKRGVRSRAETQNRNLIGTDHAASNCVRANPVKRFVLSNVRSVKHVGRLRVPQQVRSEHIQVNTTHFIVGESVLLSPRFLVWEPFQVRQDHVIKSNDSRISQISYREMNIFGLSRIDERVLFSQRNNVDMLNHRLENESGGDDAPHLIGSDAIPSFWASSRSFLAVISVWASPVPASWLAVACGPLSEEPPVSGERHAKFCRSPIELGGE